MMQCFIAIATFWVRVLQNNYFGGYLLFQNWVDFLLLKLKTLQMQVISLFLIRNIFSNSSQLGSKVVNWYCHFFSNHFTLYHRDGQFREKGQSFYRRILSKEYLILDSHSENMKYPFLLIVSSFCRNSEFVFTCLCF